MDILYVFLGALVAIGGIGFSFYLDSAVFFAVWLATVIAALCALEKYLPHA
jgi:hypothetical protein